MAQHENVVASSRIRLARNLNGYPFPSRLKDDKQAKEIIRDNSPVLTPEQWRAEKEEQKKVETIPMQLVPDFRKK